MFVTFYEQATENYLNFSDINGYTNSINCFVSFAYKWGAQMTTQNVSKRITYSSDKRLGENKRLFQASILKVLGMTKENINHTLQHWKLEEGIPLVFVEII